MSGGSSISELDGSTIALVMMMMMILAPDSFLLLPPAAPPPPSSSSPAHGVSSSTSHTDMTGGPMLATCVEHKGYIFTKIQKNGYWTLSYQKPHCTGDQP